MRPVSRAKTAGEALAKRLREKKVQTHDPSGGLMVKLPKPPSAGEAPRGNLAAEIPRMTTEMDKPAPEPLLSGFAELQRLWTRGSLPCPLQNRSPGREAAPPAGGALNPKP